MQTCRPLIQQLHWTKEGLHKGRFLIIFSNFFRIAFQQNSSVRVLPKVCEIHQHWCLHFSSSKETLLHSRKNYLKGLQSDKLSRDGQIFQVWPSLNLLIIIKLPFSEQERVQIFPLPSPSKMCGSLQFHVRETRKMYGSGPQFLVIR